MMRPEIVIMLGSNPANVGTELNVFRAAMYKAITTDSDLIALVRDRYGIDYIGATTGLARGRDR